MEVGGIIAVNIYGNITVMDRKIHIVSPVDNLAEAEMLLDAGANELYGGFLPEEWSQHYSLLTSLNQRTFSAAQISSLKDLKSIVNLVHARKRVFALTLNAPFYTEDQIPLLVNYVDQMVSIGVDSIILADLGLLRVLRNRHPDLDFHASTLAHLSNAGAVKFYADQGVSRVVLPRHLSVEEVGNIAQKTAQYVRCDVFLLVGKCPNTEGLCTFHHASPKRIWPCEIPYSIKAITEKPSKNLRRAINRQSSWSSSNRRHGCGLCAIPALLKTDIFGLKLVGRGAPSAQKVLNIKMTREFIALANIETNFERYRQRAMEAHRHRFGAECNVNVCYYPEFFPGSDEL